MWTPTCQRARPPTAWPRKLLRTDTAPHWRRCTGPWCMMLNSPAHLWARNVPRPALRTGLVVAATRTVSRPWLRAAFSWATTPWSAAWTLTQTARVIAAWMLSGYVWWVSAAKTPSSVCFSRPEWRIVAAWSTPQILLKTCPALLNWRIVLLGKCHLTWLKKGRLNNVIVSCTASFIWSRNSIEKQVLYEIYKTLHSKLCREIIMIKLTFLAFVSTNNVLCAVINLVRSNKRV